MENERESESTVDWFGGKKFKVVETILAGLNLEKETCVSFEDFRQICVSLFEPDEVNGEEGRIKEIFEIFDLNGDGVLKDSEWKLVCEWIQEIAEPVNVLLVVDVQNDFIDGSLAIRSCGCGQDGIDVINPINRLIKEGRWNKVIYSLDWHPANHLSFYENLHMREVHPESQVTKENATPFDTVTFCKPAVKQILWPRHCVMNTWGSELHKDLIVAPNSEKVRKGTNSESEAYSAFDASNDDGSAELQNILSKVRVTRLYVCGLAYDICVKSTCLDGLRLGYALAVVDDCCRGIDLDGIESAKELIRKNGGLIASSDTVLSLVNEGKRSLVMSHRAAKRMGSASSFSNDFTSRNSGNSL